MRSNRGSPFNPMWILFCLGSFFILYLINEFSLSSASSPSPPVVQQRRPQRATDEPSANNTGSQQSEVSVYVGDKLVKKKTVDLAQEADKRGLSRKLLNKDNLRGLSKIGAEREVEVPVAGKKLKGKASVDRNGDITIKIPESERSKF